MIGIFGPRRYKDKNIDQARNLPLIYMCFLIPLIGGAGFLAGRIIAREIACRRNWNMKMEEPITIKIVKE